MTLATPRPTATAPTAPAPTTASPPPPPAPRLGHLVGVLPGGPGLDDHLRHYSTLPQLGPGELGRLAADAGLVGRGGAGFPTARKLAAVAGARRAGRTVVVGNGAESEPASGKDRTLLRVRPNLVLDGLQLAATEVSAGRVVLYVHRDPILVGGLRALVDQRVRLGVDAHRVEVVEAPPRFLAGEESALASRVSGGLALPRFTPPRVFQSGVDGAPTLVQNVETLAQLALLARFGSQWFRSAGLADEPGSMLTTVHSPDRRRVQEVALGTPLTSLLGDPLLPDGPIGAVLVGGFHGTWLSTADAVGLRLGNTDLRPRGASVGAGVIVALPAGVCGVVETARVVSYLAAESAGQCGPCVNGLPAIAGGMTELADLRPRPQARDDLLRWAGLVAGRGACHHPDGTVRLVRSALQVFAQEIEQHAAGRCTATDTSAFLQVPTGLPTRDEDWS